MNDSTDVKVLNMELSSKEFSEKLDSFVWYFRVTDVRTSDPDIAKRVACGGCQMNGKVRELGAAAEWFMLAHARPDIDKVHQAGKRCLLVFDVATFPRISMHMDTRDQAEMRRNVQQPRFDRDLISRWRNYNRTVEVPAVFLNENETFKGLKILRFDANLR